MATPDYASSNQVAPQQTFNPWSTQPVPQQRPATMAYSAVPPPVPTQPAPQPRLSAWPTRPPPLPSQRPSAWPTQPLPQPPAFSSPAAPAQTFNACPTPPAPKWPPNPPVAMVDPVVLPTRKPGSKARAVVAWSLWVFAGGLLAGPLLADYADQGMEAGLAWVSAWAPNFLRPYLPLPLERPASPPPRASVERPAAVPPAAEPAQAREPPAAPKPSAPIAAPPSGAEAPVAKAKAAQAERKVREAQHTAKASQPRLVHGSHGKVKATFAAAEPHPAVKRAAGKRGVGSDPFESYEGGASAPAPLKRAAKPAPELAPAARSSARSSDGLDELMAGAARGTGSKPSAKH